MLKKQSTCLVALALLSTPLSNVAFGGWFCSGNNGRRMTASELANLTPGEERPLQTPGAAAKADEVEANSPGGRSTKTKVCLAVAGVATVLGVAGAAVGALYGTGVLGGDNDNAEGAPGNNTALGTTTLSPETLQASITTLCAAGTALATHCFKPVGTAYGLFNTGGENTDAPVQTFSDLADTDSGRNLVDSQGRPIGKCENGALAFPQGVPEVDSNPSLVRACEDVQAERREEAKKRREEDERRRRRARKDERTEARHAETEAQSKPVKSPAKTVKPLNDAEISRQNAEGATVESAGTTTWPGEDFGPAGGSEPEPTTLCDQLLCHDAKQAQNTHNIEIHGEVPALHQAPDGHLELRTPRTTYSFPVPKSGTCWVKTTNSPTCVQISVEDLITTDTVPGGPRFVPANKPPSEGNNPEGYPTCAEEARNTQSPTWHHSEHMRHCHASGVTLPLMAQCADGSLALLNGKGEEMRRVVPDENGECTVALPVRQHNGEQHIEEKSFSLSDLTTAHTYTTGHSPCHSLFAPLQSFAFGEQETAEGCIYNFVQS